MFQGEGKADSALDEYSAAVGSRAASSSAPVPAGMGHGTASFDLRLGRPEAAVNAVQHWMKVIAKARCREHFRL